MAICLNISASNTYADGGRLMRITHTIFTMGLTALIAAWLGLGIVTALLAAVWLA